MLCAGLIDLFSYTRHRLWKIMFFFYTCLVRLQWIRHKLSLSQMRKKADFLPAFSVPVLAVHNHLDKKYSFKWFWPTVLTTSRSWICQPQQKKCCKNKEIFFFTISYYQWKPGWWKTSAIYDNSSFGTCIILKKISKMCFMSCVKQEGIWTRQIMINKKTMHIVALEHHPFDTKSIFRFSLPFAFDPLSLRCPPSVLNPQTCMQRDWGGCQSHGAQPCSRVPKRAISVIAHSTVEQWYEWRAVVCPSCKCGAQRAAEML